ncbi:MAG: SCO family protein [Desulfobacterales bacterium]|nr:SCO family protein [Desulfobacterales bacterium]
MKNRLIGLLVLYSVIWGCLCPCAYASQAESEKMGHDHHKMMMETPMPAEEIAAKVYVDERLGETIDFSAQLKDENNQSVDLKTLFDKPVVILPIFFMCSSVCNILQAELTRVLDRISDIPGEDFNVVTLSFSDDEDAAMAKTAKQNYAQMLQRKMDPAKWVYLVGERPEILKLTRSLGFYFVKQGKNNYIHPNVMIVLSGQGRIIRYLYGPRFLAFDVGMALNEAMKGEPGVSIKRGVLSFCFNYDPENRTYVFRMFPIVGGVIVAALALFFVFLILPKRSRRGRQHK